MGKVGGERNFGFGKQMAWAGTQALRDRYGDGHYATVAAHTARWGQFVDWAKTMEGIRDARDVTLETAVTYGERLAEQVRQGTLAVAYAQNLLSTVNVVLEALRGDRVMRIAPARLVGERSHVRERIPAGLDRTVVQQCIQRLRAEGHDRVAAVVELARDLGLREREASLLDARVGLRRAAAVQRTSRNLIPEDKTWRQWNDHLHHVWAAVKARHGLEKLHDLRAAYACDRYLALTGRPAPVITGKRMVEPNRDRQARETLARELGHARIDVVSAYLGK